MKAEVYLHTQAALGEGPLWDDARQCLYFVDIEGKALHRVRAGQDECFPMPSRISTVALTDGDPLLIALEDGVYFFSPDTGERTLFVRPEPGLVGNRGNDGKPDPAGNLWQDTMPMVPDQTGGLYRIRPDGSFRPVLSGLKCANGMGWSPDRRTMYFIDTPSRAVWAFDYDAEKGDIHPDSRVTVVDFSAFPPEEGGPDGMTVDAEGKIWVAQWGGFCVCRYDPITGERLLRVEVPAPCATCPTFIGENLDQLLITTAGMGRDPYPLSGDLFVAKVGVRGLPANRFHLLSPTERMATTHK